MNAPDRIRIRIPRTAALTCILLMHGTVLTAAEPQSEYPRVEIAYAAARNDHGSIHLGERVTVQGVATTTESTFARSYYFGFIQDQSGGIALYDRQREMPSFRPGDVLEVRGEIIDFRGVPQIAVQSARKVGNVPPPRALEVRPEEAASPKFLGQLIRIKARVESLDRRTGLKVDLETTGSTSLSFYLYEHLAEELAAMNIPEGAEVRVTGIASQYDPVAPYDTGWQILLRDSSDIRILSRPMLDSEALRKALPATLLVSVAIIAWIILLRRQVKRQTESLAQTLAVLKSQQEATFDGILITDSSGRVNTFNRRFSSIWGIPGPEIENGSVDDVIARQADKVLDSQSFLSRLREITTGSGGAVLGDEEVLLKDGRIVSISSVPVLSTETAWHGRAWYFQDITRRKLLERQVEQANRVQSLGRLSAGVAHEFNNVLMGIQPFVDILKRRNSDERSQHALMRISESVARGRRITGEVLRFTRPAQPVLESIDFDEFFDSIEEELRSILRSEIELIVERPTDQLAVSGDRQMLSQVFVNLAVNAQHAITGHGSLTIAARRSGGRTVFPFGVISEGEFVHITVSDTGSGIPEELIPHIFEPLFTIKGDRGSGLGLAVVQQVMTEHAGHIFVESSTRKGTTFHLFLRPGLEQQMQRVARQETATVESCRILLVEDDRVVAEGIAASLESEGARVSLAHSGELALEMIEAEAPDAVVLDHDLPGINGAEVFARIRERMPFLPVIFSTAHEQPQLLETVQRDGSATLLLKPYDTATLLRALADLSR